MSERVSEEQVDKLIERLLSVRNARPFTTVNLTEEEIKALCYTAREIFL